jgi:hypothetical protein
MLNSLQEWLAAYEASENAESSMEDVDDIRAADAALWETCEHRREVRR